MVVGMLNILAKCMVPASILRAYWQSRNTVSWTNWVAGVTDDTSNIPW